MRVTLAVSGPGSGTGGAPNDLSRWLRRHPELRDRVALEPGPEPVGGTMGAAGELVSLLLAPGGVTAALAAAVVAWLQNRRGTQTVTITMPDGTQVTVSSERVRDLTAEASGEVAERVAEAIRPRPDTSDGPPRPAVGTDRAPGTDHAVDEANTPADTAPTLPAGPGRDSAGQDNTEPDSAERGSAQQDRA